MKVEIATKDAAVDANWNGRVGCLRPRPVVANGARHGLLDENRSEPDGATRGAGCFFGGGPRFLRKDAVSGAAHQPGRTPRLVRQSGTPPSLFHLVWPTETTSQKPGNPDRRLRHFAGGQVCAPRTGCPNHSDRYQRDKPKPYTSASKKYGLDNLVLHQRLDFGCSELGENLRSNRFQGVLHHMPDPELGLQCPS